MEHSRKLTNYRVGSTREDSYSGWSALHSVARSCTRRSSSIQARTAAACAAMAGLISPSYNPGS
eukprot:scaffold10716_cov113-Isochrysis_galbana.AAC.4